MLLTQSCATCIQLSAGCCRTGDCNLFASTNPTSPVFACVRAHTHTSNPVKSKKATEGNPNQPRQDIARLGRAPFGLRACRMFGFINATGRRRPGFKRPRRFVQCGCRADTFFCLSYRLSIVSTCFPVFLCTLPSQT